MNVKKFLKKQAKKDLQALETDEDRAFLRQLEDIAEKNARAKKRNLNWLWAIPSCALAGGVAAILLVELLPPAGSGPDEIKYIEANFKSVDSDMAAFSAAAKNLTVNLTADQTVTVSRTYDQASGDDLYYTLRIAETTETVFVNLDLLVVVNERYDYDDFQITESFVTETVSDFSVNYLQDITFDTEINIIQCKGKIEKPNFEIYVLNYKEYAFDEGSFLSYLDRLLNFET